MSRLRKNERDRAIGRFTPVMRSGPAPARAQLERGVLSYDATDKLLQAYGISLVRSIMAQSAGEAVNAAEKLGYPCVLKISSVDIPHKTEFDALRLGLESREAVQKAYDQMLADVRAKKPDANIEGVLVQKQIKGIECLLGISRDDQIGATLVMGLGGVFVEILADVVIRIPPITAAEARHALEGLKGAKVFSGVRGAPPADIDALAEMAARLSWLADDYKGEIAELDLNPVVVLKKGEGAFVVDALLVSRSETT